MRGFINSTSRPVTYKIWTVDVTQVTNNHLAMFKHYNIVARCLFDAEWFDSPNGQRYSYGNHAFAEIGTTTDEQVSLLQLMYGDKLILKMVETVLPNQMVTYA